MTVVHWCNDIYKSMLGDLKRELLPDLSVKLMEATHTHTHIYLLVSMVRIKFAGLAYLFI